MPEDDSNFSAVEWQERLHRVLDEVDRELGLNARQPEFVLIKPEPVQRQLVLFIV